MTNHSLIPLSILALELETAPANLAARLADRVLLDDLHRPAVDRALARDLIIAHQDAQAAAAAAEREADAAHRAAIAAQGCGLSWPARR